MLSVVKRKEKKKFRGKKKMNKDNNRKGTTKK